MGQPPDPAPPIPGRRVILLAEDSEDDAFIFRRSLENAYINSPLHIVKDGEQAIAYLSGTGQYGNRSEYPIPDLLVLDIKMPRVDGFEVLSWVRKHPTFRAMPVIVLTSSDDIRDLRKAYKLGANSFLIKPADFHNIVNFRNFLLPYCAK